jgi:type VI secretion system secreted protein Hcp
MAVDYFLKLSTIRGESEDSKHKDEIDVLSFSWGVSAATTQTGGGAVAGKAAFNDFSIVKILDTATPRLMQACCTGEHIPEANFTGRKSGGDQFEFMKIKLTDVLISGVSPGGSSGDQVPLEQVSFSFGSSLITVFRQDATGQIGGDATAVLCGGSRL